MKKIYSCLFILTLFLSCSPDNDQYIAEKNDALSGPAQTNQFALRQANEPPVNSNNSFDIAGETYNEILDSYFTTGGQQTNVASILNQVESIATSNSRFQSIKESNYQTGLSGPILHITVNPVTSIPEIIGDSGMSSYGKSSFNTFLQNLKTRCKSDESFEAIYDYIVSYENSVTESALFSTRDKRIILSSTSISRFSTYRRKRKPKKNTDQDWDWMIASIIASTEGVAEYSTGNAITMSATITIKFD